ncbi:ParB N-terminal domain-containing protein [Microtetraspora malaysiensis]|uniref:ParB N-terminal domain-containing protein n=1 Tax=Microtetraspora malaysiensis TaxID=161358 RepID=UPI003D8D39B4
MESLLSGSVERVAISSLKNHPDNPRRGDLDVIAESLRENGQFAPLVVQASTSYILAGNHRYPATTRARTATGMKITPWMGPVEVLCGDCDRQLGPAWWCADCAWIERGKIGYPGRERALIRPCPAHAGATG